MSRLVLLDCGPLGKATNPRATPGNTSCAQWMEALLASGVSVLVPEIADYELRRELLRATKTAGLARLDALIARIGYLPLTTEIMRKAAEIWAVARQTGQPTADDKALDGDVILCAQAQIEIAKGHDVMIATTNVGHLSRFAPAETWDKIT